MSDGVNQLLLYWQQRQNPTGIPLEQTKAAPIHFNVKFPILWCPRIAFKAIKTTAWMAKELSIHDEALPCTLENTRGGTPALPQEVFSLKRDCRAVVPNLFKGNH